MLTKAPGRVCGSGADLNSRPLDHDDNPADNPLCLATNLLARLISPGGARRSVLAASRNRSQKGCRCGNSLNSKRL